MSWGKRNFLFLNVGHLLDHYFMLIFATAILTMDSELTGALGSKILLLTWSAFFFGAAAIPSGWLGDKWSRHGMMFVFFVGIGAASVLTSMAQEAWQVELGLALIGIFGAIYHPIGLALVVREADRGVGRSLAINGVWGNMGVALAAICTAALADAYGWRMAFIVPGVISIGIGILYGLHLRGYLSAAATAAKKKSFKDVPVSLQKKAFVFLLIAPLFGGLIFQATTYGLPLIMEERLVGMFDWSVATQTVTFLVFAFAALAQLVVGELLDRYSTRKIYISLVAVQLALCAVLVNAFGMTSIIFTLPLMLATFGIIPINDWIVAHYIGKDYHSRVYALKSVFSLGVAALAVQAMGHLHNATGSFDSLFIVLAASAGVVLLATLALLPRGNRNMAEAQPAE